MTNRAVVEVSELRKSYGDRTVVDGVSFAVEEGEIFGILGPNGAGKTTTVECVEGLRVPDGGDIARELFISEATVKTHLSHLFTKLGVNDRAAAVAKGYELGILGRD